MQGCFKSEQSVNLWRYSIISQFREEQQPEEHMRNYLPTLIKEPKYENEQFS